MSLTKYELKDQEAVLAKLEERQAELTEAAKDFDAIQKKLKNVRADVEAIMADTEMPMTERREALDELHASDAGLRAELGPSLEVMGNRQGAEEELEALEPQVEEAKAHLAQLKRDYGKTKKKFSSVDDSLKILRKEAALIDDLVVQLAAALLRFWQAHKDIQRPALEIGAKRGRGFGTILETAFIDGIFQRMLWPIFNRSMMSERPADGGGGSLLEKLPQTAGQFIGEDAPEPDKKKAA